MTDTTELEQWLRRDYPTAFRTACLVLGDPGPAAAAVHEAFLRTWRARAAIPSGERRTAWFYRALVSCCLTRTLEDEAPTASVTGVPAALADLPTWLRTLVVLQSFTGLSPAQIAIAVDRRPGAVAHSLADARQHLSLDPRLSTLEVSR